MGNLFLVYILMTRLKMWLFACLNLLMGLCMFLWLMDLWNTLWIMM